MNNNSYPPGFSVIILGGFSPEIPDATPVLLQKGPSGRCFFESFLKRLKENWQVPLVIVALPEEDKYLPEIQQIMHRMPLGIKFWFGSSFDVAGRLFTVMDIFSVNVALKLRAKDFLADYEINRKIVDSYVKSQAELAWAPDAANGLAGIVIGRTGMRKFMEYRSKSEVRLGFSALWTTELGLTLAPVESTVLSGNDLTVGDPEDISFLREIEDWNAAGDYKLIEMAASRRSRFALSAELYARTIPELVSKRIDEFRQPEKPLLLCLAAHRWDEIPQRNHHLAKELSRYFNVVFFESVFPPVKKLMENCSVSGSNVDVPAGEHGENSYWERLSFELAREKDGILILKAAVSAEFNIHNRNKEQRQTVGAYLQALCDRQKPDVIMTYFPQYWDIAAPCIANSKLFVYDCCDEFSGFSGNWENVAELEEEMTKHTNMAFASSDLLGKKLRNYCKNVEVIPNGVNYEYIKSIAYAEENPFSEKHPSIGFIGGIAEWFDQELVCKAADMRPDWIFIIFGPVLWTDVTKLKKRSNILLPGALDYKLVPYILRSFDICMIPFKINKLTLSVDPVKLYEYFAAGKPVVSTGLPEVLRYGKNVSCVKSAEAFVDAVETECKRKDDPDFKRDIGNIARGRDWRLLGDLMGTSIMKKLGNAK